MRLGEGQAVTLSPDGKWALALTMASPSQLVLLPSGAGDAQQITHDDLYHNWARWLPDSKGFVFTATREGHGAQIYLQKSISEPSHPISPEGVDSLAMALSPDGSQVAGIGPDSLAYLYPVAGRPAQTDPGFSGRGAADRMVGGRQVTLRLSSRRVSGEGLEPRSCDGQAHPLAKSGASRSRRGQPDRPDRHDPGRQVLHLRLPSNLVRPLPGRRTQVGFGRSNGQLLELSHVFRVDGQRIQHRGLSLFLLDEDVADARVPWRPRRSACNRCAPVPSGTDGGFLSLKSLMCSMTMRLGYFLRKGIGSWPATMTQPQSISKLTLAGSVFLASTSQGRVPSIAVNSATWLW